MKSVESLTDLLRVLGEPTRLRLLTALNHGELSVREITQVTGLSQPRVSRHLKLLCEARILKRTRDQNEVYYRATIDDDRRALVQEVLGNLPLGDRLATRDRERLTAILDARQARVVLEEGAWRTRRTRGMSYPGASCGAVDPDRKVVKDCCLVDRVIEFLSVRRD